ncbi:MAG: hypothetical protein ACTS6G_03840 [Candidatus Hodgkinia cicadicola]
MVKRLYGKLISFRRRAIRRTFACVTLTSLIKRPLERGNWRTLRRPFESLLSFDASLVDNSAYCNVNTRFSIIERTRRYFNWLKELQTSTLRRFRWIFRIMNLRSSLGRLFCERLSTHFDWK